MLLTRIEKLRHIAEAPTRINDHHYVEDFMEEMHGG